ncbi:MAG: hypothetical protein L6R43_08330 [Planctomycetes bacterium]|nr:hypothetical protein [Planctomycetota bacterium]
MGHPFRPALLPLLLLPVLLLPACAGPKPPPPLDGLPADFLLEVRSSGATNPHCDFGITVDASGRADYAIRHRGAKAGDRRGATGLPPEAVRELRQAALDARLGELPARIPPQEGGQERGVVSFRLRDSGRERTVVADHAGTPGTDGILAALFRLLPLRVWRVPGEE